MTAAPTRGECGANRACDAAFGGTHKEGTPMARALGILLRIVGPHLLHAEEGSDDA